MDRHTLKQSASYALKNTLGNNNMELGEGLVGQAAKGKKIIIFDHVPASHCNITIQSALGESEPQSIIIVPLLYEDTIQGVIEFGSGSKVHSLHKEFLTNIASAIAINVHSIKHTNQR